MRDEMRRGLRYAFVTLFDDVFGWIAVGIVAAAMIRVLVPPETLLAILGGPLQSMLVMALVGVPLYVCAEASTPIAAVLIAQGVSPGAALVFLLVGPATNLGAIGVLGRTLGWRTVITYLAVVVAAAVCAGLLIDLGAIDIGPSEASHADHGRLPAGVATTGAVIFLALGVRSLFRHRWGRWAVAASAGVLRRRRAPRAT
jgi:hypothetical protein